MNVLWIYGMNVFMDIWKRCFYGYMEYMFLWIYGINVFMDIWNNCNETWTQLNFRTLPTYHLKKKVCFLVWSFPWSNKSLLIYLLPTLSKAHYNGLIDLQPLPGNDYLIQRFCINDGDVCWDWGSPRTTLFSDELWYWSWQTPVGAEQWPCVCALLSYHQLSHWV